MKFNDISESPNCEDDKKIRMIILKIQEERISNKEKIASLVMSFNLSSEDVEDHVLKNMLDLFSE